MVGKCSYIIALLDLFGKAPHKPCLWLQTSSAMRKECSNVFQFKPYFPKCGRLKLHKNTSFSWKLGRLGVQSLDLMSSNRLYKASSCHMLSFLHKTQAYSNLKEHRYLLYSIIKQHLSDMKELYYVLTPIWIGLFLCWPQQVNGFRNSPEPHTHVCSLPIFSDECQGYALILYICFLLSYTQEK